MTKWLPIETYDKLKKKPPLAVFRFKPTEPIGISRDFLVEAFKTERNMGHRVCTHWFKFDVLVLGEPPE